MIDIAQPQFDNFFEKVAVKYLTEVDANPKKSNQHEIGGLKAAGFFEALGDPGVEVVRYNCTMVYLEDQIEIPLISNAELSWYDTRRNNPNRSPEYRLYYTSNDVTIKMRAGDLLIVVKRLEGDFLFLITPSGSNFESQLRYIFSIQEVGTELSEAGKSNTELSLPCRTLFESLGIEISPIYSTTNPDYEKILEEYVLNGFPTTKEFSEKTRLITGLQEPLKCPDTALIKWCETEEMLFKVVERRIVEKKLEQGFEGEVDKFISYSLSVLNRRKSRAGHSLENHLEYVFSKASIRFEKGGSKRVTELKKKPDFMFPGFQEYHDPNFENKNLRLLAAKTTCKDRWRQVLSEAEQIPEKHLITLQGAISENQTNEMKASKLQLVVPLSLQKEYSSSQQGWLISLGEFIEEVRSSQDVK